MFHSPQQRLQATTLYVLATFVLIMPSINLCHSSSRVKVTCNREEMQVTVTLPPNQTVSSHMKDVVVYLDKLREYPGCQPTVDTVSNSLKFILPLGDDFYSCGTSRLHNKLTGTKVYYHKVLIEERITSRHAPSTTAEEADAKLSLHKAKTSSSSTSSTSPSSSSSHSSPSSPSSSSTRNEFNRHRILNNNNLNKEGNEDESGRVHHYHSLSSSQKQAHQRGTSEPGTSDDWSQEAVVVKCIVPSDSTLRRFRRQSGLSDLPENFTESSEELIDYSGNVTASAPIPLLNIAVKQNGEFVDTALNVSPGTPLEMIIYLDDVSANVYGLLTSFLRVTDNTPRKQEEIIILNGCSIDPYIFANFETTDGGKSLSAKFRAFKFPESNYVLFVGTVNVCLNSCLGVQCGEGQIGYGKRKRRSPINGGIPNLPYDPNKVFEAELTAFVKVGYTNNPSSGTLSHNDLSYHSHISSQYNRERSSNKRHTFPNSSSSPPSSSSSSSSIDLFPSGSGAKIESRPASSSYFTASKYSSSPSSSASSSSSSSSSSLRRSSFYFSPVYSQRLTTATLTVVLNLILFYFSSCCSLMVTFIF